MFKHVRLTKRKLSIGAICLLLIGFWYFVNVDEKPIQNSVSFVKANHNTTDTTDTYQTVRSNRIKLNVINTSRLYKDFNSSLCYINGTDIKLMKRHQTSWKCECLPGYHGADCAQPEVIWRALLTSTRKNLLIKGPRKIERRIIYMFETSEILKIITDIRINELNDVIDLFVLYERGDFISRQMKFGFLKLFHKKILYLPVNGNNGSHKNIVYRTVRNVLDLKNEDLILISSENEIPNRAALQFFRLYDGFPDPIAFRLRWSVYGFFWIHPNHTVLKTLGFKVKNFDLKNRQGNFNIGDLNHFGGWFCEFCNDPRRIIDEIKSNKLIKVVKRTIDVDYVEEMIENGVYIDGKTELIRAHRSSEAYFAPGFLMEHDWKYDYLMLNIYSKMDYYE